MIKQIQIEYVHDKDKVKLRHIQSNLSLLSNASPDIIRIRPKNTAVISTGVKIYIPTPGLIGVVVSMPSSVDSGLCVFGGSQIIPFAHDREIKVRIRNEHASRMLAIDPFDPFCMLYFAEVTTPKYVETKKFEIEPIDNKKKAGKKATRKTVADK